MSLTPIYDELARRYGLHLPDPLEADPVHALLRDGPLTQVLPVTRPSPVPRPAGTTIRYGDVVDHRLPPAPGQDDLSANDPLVFNTAKLGPGDAQLEQPPQDPRWRPGAGA